MDSTIVATFQIFRIKCRLTGGACNEIICPLGRRSTFCSFKEFEYVLLPASKDRA